MAVLKYPMQCLYKFKYFASDSETGRNVAKDWRWLPQAVKLGTVKPTRNYIEGQSRSSKMSLDRSEAI